jgi:hypothetical protein
MSKYIDRDAVRRAIQEYCFSPYEVTPDGIAKVVMNVPPADVEEVRHGEWIDKPTGAYSRMQSWCSACRKHSGIGGIESNRHKPYCPNCGAKMKGERKENER